MAEPLGSLDSKKLKLTIFEMKLCLIRQNTQTYAWDLRKDDFFVMKFMSN